MKPRLRAHVVRLAVLAVLFFLVPLAVPLGAQEPRLYAYSTLDALLAGVYDGDLTVAELSAKGDFGLGTFNRLDGEMILLEGVCYHATADGRVKVAGPQEKTPLAYVTRFGPTAAIRPEGALSLRQLEMWLDHHLRNKNLFYAIRVDGMFRNVSVRAIARQAQPYKPLVEVARNQVVHNYNNTGGVLVGIRSPAFSRGISVPGYHWHYVTTDRKHGGHVLSLTLINGRAQYQEITALDLQLPGSKAFAEADQVKDRSEEVERVERK